MKFERLTSPGWQLPDLVGFNAKVHDWVDPWWAHRWVRWLAWAAAALFALVAAMWIYFAAGLPSANTLLAYQPPLPTNVRGYDGDPIQTFAAKLDDVDLDKLDAEATQTIDAAVEFAEASDFPSAESIYDHVYVTGDQVRG